MAIYIPYELKYTTPTVGLFIPDDDYLKFLENLDHYLSCELRFITPEEAKFQTNVLLSERYPVALLGNDVEIHFMHYKNRSIARRKWKKRAKRIDKSQLIVKMSIRENKDIEKKEVRFLQLPFKNKLLFTPNEPIHKSLEVIYVPELREINNKNIDETPYLKRYINIPNLLKGNFSLKDIVKSPD